MPSSFSYTQYSTLPVAPTGTSDPVISPDGGKTSVAIRRHLTIADFLDLFERILPFDYLQPLKDPGPGYEILQMYAALFERVSEAVGHAEANGIIIYSHGEFRATGTVEFIRPDTAAGTFTIKRGFVVSTSNTNRKFVVTEDTEFANPNLTVQASIKAIAPGAAYNVRGPRVSAGDELLPGEIDTISLPLMDPPYAEPDISCRQVGDTDHGQGGVLDQHGDDRRIDRRTDEIDDQYRYRIRTLPDTVSIDALRRQLDAIFLPLGLAYDLIETFENRLTGCWSPPDLPIPNIIQGQFDPTLFVYNDTRDHSTFTGVWLGEATHRGALILVVPDLGSIAEMGMAYNDTGSLQTDFVTGFGHRAQSAWNADVGSGLVFPGAWNGTDEALNSFYLSLLNLLNQIKAGGVNVDIELAGSQ